MILLFLRDMKADFCYPPFVARTVGVAMRDVVDQVRRGGAENVLSAHPEDFECYKIGTWDDMSGELYVSGDLSSGLAVVPERVFAVKDLLGTSQ